MKGTDEHNWIETTPSNVAPIKCMHFADMEARNMLQYSVHLSDGVSWTEFSGVFAADCAILVHLAFIFLTASGAGTRETRPYSLESRAAKHGQKERPTGTANRNRQRERPNWRNRAAIPCNGFSDDAFGDGTRGAGDYGPAFRVAAR